MRILIDLQRFAFVGAVATGTQYLILVAAVLFLGARPVIASTCGYVLSAALNYYLNHRLTFRSSRSHLRAIPRFVVVTGVGLMVNGAVVWLLSERSLTPYVVAQLCATAAVLGWNYFGNRTWTY